MIPPLDLKAPSLCRLVLLAATGPLIQAQAIQAPQNAQVTPSITKFTDINVGSVVARPFSGALVRLNSSLGTNSARGGISLGRFTLSGKKGDGWILATDSTVPFTLTGPRGGTLRVTALTMDPNTTSGMFPASGTTGEFSMGVALAGGTGTTPAGLYTGNFNLSLTDLATGRVSTTIFIVRADYSPAISISKSADLNFGNIIASGALGTVVLPPEGPRSATGGAALASGGNVGPAIFTVVGEPGINYTISMPPGLALTGPGVPLNVSLTSSPTTSPGAGLLDGSGQQTLKVGGTLTVAANQLPGAYSGTFNVTVAYN